MIFGEKKSNFFRNNVSNQLSLNLILTTGSLQRYLLVLLRGPHLLVKLRGIHFHYGDDGRHEKGTVLSSHGLRLHNVLTEDLILEH